MNFWTGHPSFESPGVAPVIVSLIKDFNTYFLG